MAEINKLKQIVNKISVRYLLYVVILLFLVLILQSQNIPDNKSTRKRIDLKNADIDDTFRDPLTGKDIHHLLGNVRLQDDKIKMWCDSALYYPDKNQVTAYSKIHIQQGDTLNLYGEYLFYDGKTGLAFVKTNVELIDKDTHCIPTQFIMM